MLGALDLDHTQLIESPPTLHPAGMLEPPSTNAGVEAGLEGLRLEGDEGQPRPQSQPKPHLLLPGSTVPHHLDVAASAACRDDDASAPSEQTPLPIQHAWGPADAGGFPVRDAHYKRLGKKAAGGESFYELKAFDFIQTPRGA